MPAREFVQELVVYTRRIEIRQVRGVRHQRVFGERQRGAQRKAGAAPRFGIA